MPTELSILPNFDARCDVNFSGELAIRSPRISCEWMYIEQLALLFHHLAQFVHTGAPLRHPRLPRQVIDYAVLERRAVRRMDSMPASHFGDHQSQTNAPFGDLPKFGGQRSTHLRLDRSRSQIRLGRLPQYGELALDQSGNQRKRISL